ncbi:BamA/TamA family outer membrane protein [Adhaeribacter swui]|uniref:BamA/TamA family outer membrane protein n=1 Tax=Adhaeribacter swui TaxID=2086471 RepID=A0A7G7G3B4_9BACT|nr:BamA/TamA family outer membrane protein [Adhaeribacter swui]QNF31648.1 BamA/TamA family outer membrane protein [Adhaeribacter swui]
MKKIYLFFCFFLFFLPYSQAMWPSDSTVVKKKLSLTPFPALFSTPETGIGYGGLVVPVYNFGSDSLTRSSNGQLLAYYTQKKQSSVQLTYTIYTNHERFNITGAANYYDWPILYYGTGNSNALSDSSLVTYKLFLFQNRFLKKIKNFVFAGVQYQLTHINDVRYKNVQSKIIERNARELDGSTASGLGPALLLDSRDNPLNATKGWYAELGTYFNQKALGSEFNFTRYNIDVRRFIPLSAKKVLAIQGVGKFSTGKVPFREMALLGGGRTMRGFYEGRFRDRQLLAVQTEYRQQLFSRLGFVVFGGLGQVADRGKDLNLNLIKRAAGGGVRLMLNRAQRLNIRIDYAIGSDKAKGLYFDIGEAF